MPRRLLPLAFSLFALSCGDSPTAVLTPAMADARTGGGTTCPAVPSKTTNVLLTPATATIEVGATQTYTAKNQAGVAIAACALRWNSNNTAIATVASTGIATAQANGSAVITASVVVAKKTLTGTAQLIVAAPVVSVTLDPSTATLSVGGTQQLVATPRDAAGAPLTGRSVSWSSSAPGVATVSAGGLVTAVATGTATITATSEGKTGTAAITVRPPVARVTVTPATATIDVGQTQQLAASTFDAQDVALSGRIVTWSINDETRATVSALGVVTGKAAGVVTVTATSEGIAGTSTITIRPPIGAVRLSADSAQLAVGDETTLVATVYGPDDAVVTGEILTWTSSDPQIATVSNTGVVTALAVGSAQIRAAIPGFFAEATIRIGLNYRGQDLTGQGFRYADLRTADFTSATAVGVQFDYANLERARLTNGDFRSARIIGVNFTSAEMTGVKFQDATFNEETKWPAGFELNGRGLLGPGLDYTNVDFTGRGGGFGSFRYINFSDGIFVGATMTYKDMTGASFARANLTNANLLGSSMAAVNFTGANLAGVVWTTANFNRQTQWPDGFSPAGKGMWGPGLDYSHTNLSGVVLRYVDFLKARFDSATMTGSNLFGSSLEGASLRQANLVRASLEDTDLSDADLTGAALDGTNLRGSRITALTKFQGAIYDDATMWPAGVDPVALGAVKRVVVASVTVTPASASLLVGATQQLTATVKDVAGNVLTDKTVIWTSSAPSVATVSGTGLVTAVGAGTAVITATSDGKNAPVGISVSDRPILFGYSVDGSIEAGSIYAIQPDGTRGRVVLSHPANDMFPSLSPDGSQIAFSSNRHCYPCFWGDVEVFVADTSGTNIRQLTSGLYSTYGKSWSGDGSRLVFEAQGATYLASNLRLYTIAASGGTATRITSSFARLPDWSGVTDRLVFSDENGVSVMRPDGTDVSRVRSMQGGDPRWSPDGQLIAFTDPSGIMVMNADGTGARLVAPAVQLTDNPAWSPDGRELAFRSNRSGVTQVWIIGLDGTGLRQVTNFSGGALRDISWR